MRKVRIYLRSVMVPLLFIDVMEEFPRELLYIDNLIWVGESMGKLKENVLRIK